MLFRSLIRGEVREATVAANTGPYVKPFGGMQRPAPTVSSYEDILRLLKKLEQATKSE